MKLKFFVTLIAALTLLGSAIGQADSGNAELPALMACNHWEFALDSQGKTTKADLIQLMDLVSAPGFQFDGVERFFQEESGRLVFLKFHPEKLNWKSAEILELKETILTKIGRLTDLEGFRCVLSYGG